MLYGLYISGLGAVGQGVHLDVLANNLANVNTPGFRGDRLAFRERLVEALEDRPDFRYYNQLVHRYGGAPFVDENRWDREAGPMESTGRTLDFAVVGPGYFTVKEIGSDRLFYTRAGNFLLDSEGRLTTADGRYQVMNADGDPISVDPAGASSGLRLDAEGNLYHGEDFLHQLRIADFPDDDALVKHGENLYRYEGSDARPARDFRTFQGTLEGSSVNPVEAMVELIQTTRAMETNLQMIRLQDGTLDRLINGFGRTA